MFLGKISPYFLFDTSVFTFYFPPSFINFDSLFATFRFTFSKKEQIEFTNLYCTFVKNFSRLYDAIEIDNAILKMVSFIALVFSFKNSKTIENKLKGNCLDFFCFVSKPLQFYFSLQLFNTAICKNNRTKHNAI